MSDDWQQLVLTVRGDIESAETALFEVGALSVSIEDAADQPILEPAPGSTPIWQDARLRALFTHDVELGPIMAGLRDALAGQPVEIEGPEVLADRAWERVWLEDFAEAMRFGDRLWVCPGDARPDAADAVCVHLDPGLAFGTGTHPSTAGCLTWLDRHPPSGKRVLDYGCGSGILAIAAAKLGAAQIVAVDNDPQAEIATRENTARNGVAASLRYARHDRLAAVGYELILANILAAPLISLAPRLAALAAPGGAIALAGILDHQADAVASAYARWFDLTATALPSAGAACEQDQWMLLAGTRLTEDRD